MSSPSTPSADDDFASSVRTTRRVPFGALVSVEMRKMVDTRAGQWLMLFIVLVTVAVVVGTVASSPLEERTFLTFFYRTTIPQGFLVPVLGILLVTQEWGQRTTLTTFTLEPSRLRVMVAKVWAALVYATAFLVLSAVVALLATVAAGARDPWTDVTGELALNVALVQWLGVLMGVAFGALLLNSAAAIVAFYGVPVVFEIVGSLSGSFGARQAWFDPGAAQLALMSSELVTGKEWTQLAVTSAVWILLPLVVGLARVSRSEVK